jgi:hypothetical protein
MLILGFQTLDIDGFHSEKVKNMTKIGYPVASKFFLHSTG